MSHTKRRRRKEEQQRADKEDVEGQGMTEADRLQARAEKPLAEMEVRSATFHKIWLDFLRQLSFMLVGYGVIVIMVAGGSWELGIFHVLSLVSYAVTNRWISLVSRRAENDVQGSRMSASGAIIPTGVAIVRKNFFSSWYLRLALGISTL